MQTIRFGFWPAKGGSGGIRRYWPREVQLHEGEVCMSVHGPQTEIYCTEMSAERKMQRQPQVRFKVLVFEHSLVSDIFAISAIL